MHAQSLSFRLLIAEGLVLAAFFALVALVLEQGFRESAEQALRETLQVQVYSLLTAAKPDNDGELIMPPTLQDPRFARPGSGLYGFIQQIPNKPVWRSPSAIGLEEIVPPELSAGNSSFILDKRGRYVLHYAVDWPNGEGKHRDFIFTVAEDARFISSQVEQLQQTLRLWLLIIGVVLVFIQFALLRWSLRPLRRIVTDLEAIEHGKKTLLDGHYPTELEGLAGNLNAFITHERAHLERYRNNLADLAHSLKTPLAILRGCVESFSDNKETVQEQISRMNQIVEYQLQRAAAKGGHKAIKTVDVSVVIGKIIASLNKVYIDKNIRFELTIPQQCLIYCEEGDLYEIVGNLLDNACKWCLHSVKVSIALNQRKSRRNFSLLLEIEDDGPGIPVGKFNDILKRGIRADENTHGHGIGMTVVYELIGLLGGKLEGGKSAALGGMRWSVYLP
jgi:two-component system sensor histidine kinase PhoQ